MKFTIALLITLSLSSIGFAATIQDSKYSTVRGDGAVPNGYPLLGLDFNGEVKGYVVFKQNEQEYPFEKEVKSITIQPKGSESITFTGFQQEPGSNRAFAVRSGWHFKNVVAQVWLDHHSSEYKFVSVDLFATDTKPLTFEEFNSIDPQRMFAQFGLELRDSTPRRLVKSVKTKYQEKDLTIKLYERLKSGDYDTYFDVYVSLLGTGHTYARLLAGPASDPQLALGKASEIILIDDGEQRVELHVENDSAGIIMSYSLDEVLSEAFGMSFPRFPN